MTKNVKIKKWLLSILSIAIMLVAVLSGYFVGNIISGKYFVIDKYKHLSEAELRDDLTQIAYQGKTPEDFSAPIAFQLAEQVLKNSYSYQASATTLTNSSAGISQDSLSVERKTGDDYYIAFLTYGSFVKVAKQASFKLGGDVHMQNGTPTDVSIENVEWSNKYNDYTWDSYYDSFGRTADRNCCYIVSTKTTKSYSEVEKDGDLYKFSIVLDTELSTIGYRKAIGHNSGVNPSTIVFNDISFTFWLDKDFKFVKQDKHENYTVPYAGIEVTLDLHIHSQYTFN